MLTLAAASQVGVALRGACEPCVRGFAAYAGALKTPCPPTNEKSHLLGGSFVGGQGGIRTLGPVKDYLISSQGRYDHFDTCP